MGNAVVDLIIRIKNGYLAKKEKIESPYSRLREDILKKLIALKYIKNYKVEGEKIKKLVIELLDDDGLTVFHDVKIYSTTGKRWYVSSKQLRPVLGGMGFSLLSTSKGIMTNIEAKKQKIGGELLFDIW